MMKDALLRQALKERHALRKTFAGDFFEITAGGVAFGNFEFGQRVGDTFDFDVASRGNIHGAAERVGKVAEDLGHFLGGLEVKLIGGELHAIGIAHCLAGLDAEQDFLSVRVAVMQIVAIVGGNERDAGFFGEPDEVFVYALLDFQPLVLNFEKEITFSENVLETISILSRKIEFLIHHRLGDRAAGAGGRGDEALAVLRKEIEINARLVIEAFEESGGDQLDEVVIALKIFAKKNKVVAAAGAGLHFAAIAVGHRCGFLAAVVGGAFWGVSLSTVDGVAARHAAF